MPDWLLRSISSLCLWGYVSLTLTASFTLNAQAEHVKTVSESVAKHAAIQKPFPTISQLARQMKVSGRVEVSVTIGPQGTVTAARLVSGNPLLAEGVIIAVKNWKFRPFLQDGNEIPVSTNLSFEFKQ